MEVNVNMTAEDFMEFMKWKQHNVSASDKM